jgi:hypothetical protein
MYPNQDFWFENMPSGNPSENGNIWLSWIIFHRVQGQALADKVLQKIENEVQNSSLKVNNSLFF